MYMALTKHATPLLILTALLWLSGCATQADIQAEQRMRDSMRSQLADSRATSEVLRSELAKVRGEMEELRHRVDRAAKTRPAVSPQVRALEDRIATLERQATVPREAPRPSAAAPIPSAVPSPKPNVAPPAVSPEGQMAAVAPPPPPPALALPSEDELTLAKESFEAQEEYRAAWQALSGQRYNEAIQQFRTFQRKNPTSEMADDAQYWIGESYFTRRDYNRAILELNDVLKYRKGDKAPAALLRQAEAFDEIGDKTDARLILQKLLNDYPNSREAKDAREQLQSLGR
ncbi:MAG: tol-pal system protein YbgF [Deltaproteobacteria bacterium]|nr:tol-pal system protein YbgF [Deltaproteobacteria bacterium]